jgi:hypothetical protein
MQSQSLELAKWAIGVRLRDKSLKDVEDALNTGKIIRIHILRPTWHFVSAEDVHWMFDLSVPHLRSIYHYYFRKQRLDRDLIIRALSALEGLLSGGKHLTKQEISEALHVEKRIVDAVHINQIISYAEIERIVCNGRQRGGKQTFTSFAEWAPRRQTLLREEALERLARKFFTSHGPATIQDFAWWSGLKLTECRQALELIKDDFVSESGGGRVFWMKNDMKISSTNDPLPLLLPPFDEYVVSYTNRSEMIGDVHYGKVMTKNGLFSPTVMLNGKIVGSWKKVMKKGSPQIALSFFEKTTQKTQDLFIPAIRRTEQFWDERPPDDRHRLRYQGNGKLSDPGLGSV